MLARLLTILLTLSILPAASAADLSSSAGYQSASHQTVGTIPACDARGVLRDVTGKAGHRGQLPYQEPVTVTGYDQIRQTRHARSAGPGLRERRWCQARAHLATGHMRTVYYLIESHASFAGITYGVESCMAGRDLWHIHGGDCSALRLW